MAKREGKTLAEVVREAVDAHVAQAPPDLDAVLDETFGSMPRARGARAGRVGPWLRLSCSSTPTS